MGTPESLEKPKTMLVKPNRPDTNVAAKPSKRMARGSHSPSPFTVAVNDELRPAVLKTKSASLAHDIRKLLPLLDETGGIRFSVATPKTIVRVILCNMTETKKLVKRLESSRGKLHTAAMEKIPGLSQNRFSIEITGRRSYVEVSISMNGQNAEVQELAQEVGELMAPTLAAISRCPAAVRITSRSVSLEVVRAQYRIRPEDLSASRGFSIASNVVELSKICAYNSTLASKINRALIAGLCATSRVGATAQSHLEELLDAYTERFGPLFQWELSPNGMLNGRLAIPLGLWNLLPNVKTKDRGAAMTTAALACLAAHIKAGKFLETSGNQATAEFLSDEFVQAL